MSGKKTTLEKVIEDTGARMIRYVYDFGDDRDHSIRMERVSEATPGANYHRLLKTSGACPPEDVGAAPGHGAFREASTDPEPEQQDDLARWSGRPFDHEEDVPVDGIIEGLDQFQKTWRPSQPNPWSCPERLKPARSTPVGCRLPGPRRKHMARDQKKTGPA